tara:strand:- start:182 stop:607 length:426 start_codon:yes stop_codon:yes gene_type:complete
LKLGAFRLNLVKNTCETVGKVQLLGSEKKLIITSSSAAVDALELDINDLKGKLAKENKMMELPQYSSSTLVDDVRVLQGQCERLVTKLNEYKVFKRLYLEEKEETQKWKARFNQLAKTIKKEHEKATSIDINDDKNSSFEL